MMTVSGALEWGVVAIGIFAVYTVGEYYWDTEHRNLVIIIGSALLLGLTIGTIGIIALYLF